MNKFLKLSLASLAIGILSSCTTNDDSSSISGETKDSVTITSFNGSKEKVELTVPLNPSRVAILDLASLDVIDALNLGDRVVGSTSNSIDYLQEYVPSATNNIADLGTIKKADLVEVAASEPDIIFIGGRLASVYDDLSKIAPTVYLGTDSTLGVVESTKSIATTIAKIFGKEEEVPTMFSEYTARIDAIKTRYSGKKAIVGLYSGTSYNLLGNDGRCSLIGNEMGFANIKGDSEATPTHGDNASWETIVNLNPEYMFVLDRNSAIGAEGNVAAKDAIENDLVKMLDVYKNNNIVYLEHPNIWYTAEGGVQALDYMIKDIETALMK